MKLTTISNYINHHRIPISDELYGQLGDDFTFIQMQPMEEERVKMGWQDAFADIPYLKCYYEDPENCQKIIDDSDVVIFGGVEDESCIQNRIMQKKVIIRGSERLYREGQWKAISPRGLIKKYKDHTRLRKYPVYLLCHGGYVASDFHIVRAYPEKMFRWGYFTKVKEYNIEQLFQKKKHIDNNGNEILKLLFAGRFMKLKHPEYAIEAARLFKEKGISFQLDMVGDGEQKETLEALSKQYGLEENIVFHGFQNPEKVREFMEEANIFFFTSNHLEGWGAVLNESMNSGCAVVAGAGIGAVPFLIQNGKNGITYADENLDMFLEQVNKLINDKELLYRLGENAYQTITSLWTPELAAHRLLAFCKAILDGKMLTYEEGPLSKAPILSPRKGYRNQYEI